MLITTLIDRCNRGNINSDYVRAPEIYLHMDKVIMDINDRCNADFPLMSDYPAFVDEYNAANENNPLAVILNRANYSVIPDKWLNRVMPFGVARYFYMKDEEGEAVASDYFRSYEQALSTMARDYMMLVPEEFQNNEGGYISGIYENETITGGLVINGNDFRI